MSSLEEVLRRGLRQPGTNQNQKFADPPELGHWLKSEAKEWESLADAVESLDPITPILGDALVRPRNSFDEFADPLMADGTLSDDQRKRLDKTLGAIEAGRLATSQSPNGQLILSVAKEDPNAAAGIVLLLAGEHATIPKSGAFDLGPLIQATMRGFSHLIDTKKRHESEVKAFDKVRNDLVESLNGTKSSIRNEVEKAGYELESLQGKVKELLSDGNRLIQEKKNALAAFEDALKSRLVTDSATGLWKTEARKQFWRGLIALGVFLGLGGSGAYVLVENWSWIYGQIKPTPTSTVGVGEILLITLPAIGLAWAMRLASRVFIQAFSAERDARIRAAQAETFIALVADDALGVDEQQRLLILNALFRAPGATADDDAIPPNLLELLKRP
jgi:hypothetical protein